MKTRAQVTMKDVGKRCGVSESTVSHVINGTKFVSPEVQEKVRQAMKELSFHRDAHARRLARGHSDFVGLIISDIENPFFPGLIKAFEQRALKEGFDVLLCTTNYDPVQTEHAFRKMIENKTAGVAVMTSRVDPAMALVLEEQGLPSVFLDTDRTGRLRSNVRLNYASGAEQAVRYLGNLGHRNFVFVAGPQNRPSHLAYRGAVQTAVKRLGGTLRIIEGNNDVASGEAAVRQLAATSDFPGAILCSNDLTALGVMRALEGSGFVIPADVSVVGADDIPLLSMVRPSLTTVRIPREDLGRTAMELLIGMICERKPHGSDRVLDTELVIRESTAAAPTRPQKTPVG